MRWFRYFLPFLILVSLAPSAHSQYVFLDANGDGVNDSADQLPASGSVDLDVWFVTDHNRDGSAVFCSSDPSDPLTINTYEIVLRVLNGRVAFGPMRNRMPFSGDPVRFASRGDTTGTTVYHNGYGSSDLFPPGRYRVATLTVEVIEGSPSLSFLGYSPVEPVDLTAFGTRCSGIGEDNTAILGEEFRDASGIGRPAADAGGPYHGVVNQDVRFNGERSSDPDGDPLDFAWSFDDGGSAAGSIAIHAFGTVGTHTATLTVSSHSGSDDDVAAVEIGEPNRPVAVAGGPYHGEPGVPVPFDGSSSHDPDGDPLTYAWNFGDGGHASGTFPHHMYASEGTFTVGLTVGDGVYTASDETNATITAVVRPDNHPPVANAGGPYEGIEDRWIQFDATRSSDPDDDFLNVRWEFGDGKSGFGIAPVHAFDVAGSYTAVVHVDDGIAHATAQASVTIESAFPASAFLDARNDVVNVDDAAEFVIVRFEPGDGGAFSSEEVDPEGVVLRVTTFDGGSIDIPADGPAIYQNDSDQNGVIEYVTRFPRARFRELRASGDIQGRTHLELIGGLYAGGGYNGPFDATFVNSSSFDLTVTPNPFNPTAHIILHTRGDGPMTARLFDIRGRRVKTILHGEPLKAGRHDLIFEARDDGGSVLASGVYFLQITSAEGSRTGRVVVAK